MRSKNSGLKKVLFIYGGILVILVVSCVSVYVVYNNKIKESAKESLLATEKIAELVPNNVLEEASSEISKTINEILEENKKNDDEVTLQENNQTPEDNIENVETVVHEEKLEFISPVEGEIIKVFAIDNLVFSETLQEWIVHKGIDIKAERATVVKSAEEGTVTAIKNDPRYGLTVIIEHREGYKTVYSNLLTTEFIKEGEEVTKGQSIGTVGNSATFEIADEPHLHFEMLINEQAVDPTIYLK